MDLLQRIDTLLKFNIVGWELSLTRCGQGHKARHRSDLYQAYLVLCLANLLLEILLRPLCKVGHTSKGCAA